MTVLLHIVAVGYVAFGLFGLAVISLSSNREEMFGRSRVGRIRTFHAYLTVALMVTCGIALWFWPSAVSALALAVFALVIIGKAIDLTQGQWQTCKKCLLAGPLLILATTAILTLGPGSVAGA
ncbi:hypothetical protein [Lysobacter sp. A3-1-A15]|uniref:hypothetical protein n=1 Tax=Novilysobacter viscosus TaxID=3098602 RepID=UPI002ED93BCC